MHPFSEGSSGGRVRVAPDDVVVADASPPESTVLAGVPHAGNSANTSATRAERTNCDRITST
jgi:hypothetical protein